MCKKFRMKYGSRIRNGFQSIKKLEVLASSIRALQSRTGYNEESGPTHRSTAMPLTISMF